MSKILCPRCFTWCDDVRGHRYCPGTPERQRQDRIILAIFGIAGLIAVYALWKY